MPDQVALVIGPTGATGGPIAAALARRSGWRVSGMSRNPPRSEASFTHIAADLTDTGRLRRAGFNACVDSIAMLGDQLNHYRDARLLPR